MKKRILEMTAIPAYLLSSKRNEKLIREAEDKEDGEETGIYEFVCGYFPYIFLISGWLMFLLALVEMYQL